MYYAKLSACIFSTSLSQVHNVSPVMKQKEKHFSPERSEEAIWLKGEIKQVSKIFHISLLLLDHLDRFRHCIENKYKTFFVLNIVPFF